MFVDFLRKLDYQVLHFMAARRMRNYEPLKFVSLDHVDEICALLAEKVRHSGFHPRIVVGIGTSGVYPAWKVAQLLDTEVGYIWMKKDGFPLDDFFFKEKYLSVFPRSWKKLLFEGPVVTHKYEGPKIDGDILVVDDEADSGGTLALSKALLEEHDPSIRIKNAVLYKYPHSRNVDFCIKNYQIRDTFPPLALRLPMRKYSPFYPVYRYKVDSIGLPDQPPFCKKNLLRKSVDLGVEMVRFIKCIVWGIWQRIRGVHVEKMFSSVFSIPEEYFSFLHDDGIDTLVFDYEGVLKTIRGGVLSKKAILFLRSLHKKGFKWAVVSNCSKKDGIFLKERIHASFPDADVFTHTGKPDPSKVLLFLKNVHSSPKKAAFFGDNPFLDVKTAKNAGIEKIVMLVPMNKQYAYSWQKLAIKIFHRIFSL